MHTLTDKFTSDEFVSMGLSGTTFNTCSTCFYFKGDSNTCFGWCTHPKNNRTYGTPSVNESGGCPSFLTIL